VKQSCLIGYSGFIGSNLAQQHTFSDLYRSTNIADIEGKSYDLLVCSGVSAVKWRANQAPEEDRAGIDRLLGPLSRVRAERVILISTVDVYPAIKDVDETFDCLSRPNHAYGTNRLYVEDTIKKLFPDNFIVRLPAVFGPGLKKNVIYDLIHDNGLDVIQPDSVFQYYDVTALWDDLENMQARGIRLANLATAPIATSTIMKTHFPGKSVGAKAGPPVFYDIRSQFADALGGQDGYRFDESQVLNRLGAFVDRERKAAA
jgi:hypothetical protein